MHHEILLEKKVKLDFIEGSVGQHILDFTEALHCP